MKRVLAIFFVSLVILNTGGYYLYFVGLEIRHDSQQNRRLSNGEFSGSDAIILKVASAVPYATNDSEYQDGKGKFLYDNEVYRLVKTRRMNDTLYVVCVKDRAGAAIRDTMVELCRQFSDITPTDRQTPKFSFLKDYDSIGSDFSFEQLGTWLSFPRNAINNYYRYQSLSDIIKPPEMS